MCWFCFAYFLTFIVRLCDSVSLQMKKYITMSNRLVCNQVVTVGIIAASIIVLDNSLFSINHGWMALPYTEFCINLVGLIRVWALQVDEELLLDSSGGSQTLFPSHSIQATFNAIRMNLLGQRLEVDKVQMRLGAEKCASEMLIDGSLDSKLTNATNFSN
jgi:hypothetical protein